MKKYLSCLAAGVLLAVSFFGAGSALSENKKLNIIATTFPHYDWVRQILGTHADEVNLTLLLNSGVDLHSFQPTVSDIATIANCDLFVYVGGESDEWVEAVLHTTANPTGVTVNLIDALGDHAKAEELVEGMEHDHEHEEHEHEEEEHDHEEHDHDHGEALDEHVWLSLKNAQLLCTHIASVLGEIDPAGAADYAANAEAYSAELAALDAQYQSAMDAASQKTLLFADRFPFRYLVDDYGLSYYAAFAGCSAETEASFETIAFLLEKLNALELKNVMVTESANQSIANTLIQNSAAKNQTILVLDSMQSITAADVESGVTYLSMMEKNLETLKNAIQ